MDAEITTKEPTDDMIEVAIKAVEEVFDWKDYLKSNGIEVLDEISGEEDVDWIWIKRLIKDGIEKLQKASDLDATVDAWLLAEEVLGITRVQYFINPQRLVNKEDADKFLNL